MERRYIGLFFIGLGIVLLLLIIYFLFFFKFGQESAAPTATSTAATSSRVIEPPKILEAKPATKEEMDQEAIMRLAASFAERFGSYSNHANFQNMEDLKLFMTDRMQAWSDNFVKTNLSKQSGQAEYYGITSQAVTKKMLAYDEGKGTAKVLVQTQRRETAGQAEPVSFGQGIEIDLVKSGGTWLVDQAYWQKR